MKELQGRPAIRHVDVLGMVEIGNTAAGYFALDAMVKAAPVRIVSVRTVHPGKLLIFFTGDVASVEAAVKAGTAAAGDDMMDRLLLPRAHESLIEALDSALDSGVNGTAANAGRTWDAVGIIDAATVAAGIECADRAVKETGVEIALIRFDDAMGGRVSIRFSGTLHDIEAAVETAASLLETNGRLVRRTIIANPHPDMVGTLDARGNEQGGRA